MIPDGDQNLGAHRYRLARHRLALRHHWRERARLRRGIFLVPSLLTTGNLLCGFFALIAASNGRYTQAAIAIFVAFLFDGLDGLTARFTKTTSIFGLEYDSLADLVSFGLAPGLMLYWWALSPHGRLGWLAAGLYVICGALRLARFNAMAHVLPSRHFTGLPIPAAAGVVASAVLFSENLSVEPVLSPLLLAIGAYLLAFLMVSTIRYRSLKQLELKRRRPFNLVVIAILLLLVVAALPELMLLCLTLGYAVSGPVEALARRLHPRRLNLSAENAEAAGKGPSDP